ncbi:hypothetical protein TNCV_3177911 [Trichonephila clavipes]|nr:hypothetical protein TNCV_3177911 [Trichonephila clavipes]
MLLFMLDRDEDPIVTKALRPSPNDPPCLKTSLVIETTARITDSLAKKGSEDETVTGSSLTYQELYSNERSKLNLSWRTPPVHHWYAGTIPWNPSRS